MTSLHPGSVLLGEMLEHDWSLSEMARVIGADRELLHDFVQTRADVTPELAELLACGTGIEASFWLNVQARYDSNESIDIESSLPSVETAECQNPMPTAV